MKLNLLETPVACIMLVTVEMEKSRWICVHV